MISMKATTAPSSEPTEQDADGAGVRRKSERPGAARRLAIGNSPEGRASIRSARVVLGEALSHDGLAPLAALRLRAGLSQAQVAAMTGIQQPMLSRIENGHVTDLQRSTMRSLADAFGVSLDELDAALTATTALLKG